jgi:membrane protein involved in colicin uptake
VNGWAWRATALLLLLASYWGAYEHGRTTMNDEWQGRWAARDAGDKQAWALAEQQARQEEQRRATAQEEARVHAHEQRIVADAYGASADAAGQRLHQHAAKYAAEIGCSGPDTAATSRSEAATRAAMVLSDLLARADARAGELAKAYDRARIAGLACEASYTVLKR